MPLICEQSLASQICSDTLFESKKNSLLQPSIYYKLLTFENLTRKANISYLDPMNPTRPVGGAGKSLNSCGAQLYVEEWRLEHEIDAENICKNKEAYL